MSISGHQHWRDNKAWTDYGLRFSTTNDQAVKLWDATLTQYMGWYDEPSLGGIEKTVEKMLEADPDFAMGQVMSIGLDLMGTARNIRTDPTFQKEVDQLDKLNANQWEKKHIHAVKLWSKGKCKDAALVWENLVMENPLDLLALKFAHDQYFYFGQQMEMRDSVARVLPHWKKEMPLYGYLLGMQAFGFTETSMLPEAEVFARKGLETNANDAWSTHALAHVLEMQGRSKEGLTFMSKTMNDWAPCGMLASHNFWHWALFHIERNEAQAALDLFDNEIAERCKSGAMLDIVDATSLLYRLELDGVKVGSERWSHVHEICRPHQDEHVTVFNDVHILMSYLGVKKPAMTETLMASIRQYTEQFKDNEDSAKLSEEIGILLCQAMIDYDSGDFDQAVEKLLPIRYKLVQFGGSNAQRDVFNLLLINAALKSNGYKNLCRNIINERQGWKKDSPMNEKLMAKWVRQHDH